MAPKLTVKPGPAQIALMNIFNKQQADINRAKLARQQDIASGEKFGKKYFGNNALGSVSQERSADVADILARRKAQLEGYTPEEQQAMRDQNMKSILQSQQSGSRDLARNQARSGVRGALASAQQGAFNQQSQAQMADQERQLFLNQIAEKRNALSNFEQSQRTTEADELARQQFNMGQREKEKAGILTSATGFAGLGAQDRATAAQQAIGSQQLISAEKIAKMSEGKK